MHKNLVMVHMESVSNLILNMNEDYFPNTIKLSRDSVRYTNYYSSATSTFMVWSDIAYGSVNLLETTRDFVDLNVNLHHKESLFDILKSKGYSVKVATYPRDCHTELVGDCHLFGKAIKVDNYSNYNNFINDIEEHMAINDPFVMHIDNMLTNLSHFDKDKKRGKTSLEQYRISYKRIDDTLGRVWDALKRNKLTDNTIVILYGDHGDDFWGHNLNHGAVHATEAYAMLVNTPLLIYDKSRQPATYDDLVSAVDLKYMILNLLGFQTNKNKHIYYDIRSSREYCFARNLFANQKVKGRYGALKKSYAVMNKNYSLLLTQKGLEMYMHKIDFTSSCNILNYFSLKNNQLQYICNGKFHAHFQNFMTTSQIRDIKKNFYMLREFLLYELSKLYNRNSIPRKSRINKVLTSRIHYVKRPIVEIQYLNHLKRIKDVFE